MRTSRMLTVAVSLSLLISVANAEPQYRNDARMGNATDSAEKLLDKAQGPKGGIMKQSDTLVGRAMGQAATSITKNIPTGGQVAQQATGYWGRFTKWSTTKWDELKAWWNSR